MKLRCGIYCFVLHEAYICTVHQGDFNVLGKNGGVQEDGICAGIPSLVWKYPDHQLFKKSTRRG
jgi:hypothetical protein